MDSLLIAATKDSPEVSFNTQTNVFSIKGKSHPENVRDFYKPLIEWLDAFQKGITNKSETKISFHLNYIYINSSSYKYNALILKKMKEYVDDKINVEFTWFYEEDDDDMKDCGIELFEMTGINIPFKLESYKDE